MFTNPMTKSLENIRGDYQTKVLAERKAEKKREKKKSKDTLFGVIVTGIFAYCLLNPAFWAMFVLVTALR